MQLAGVSDPERFWCVALGSPQAVVPALGKPDLGHEREDRRLFSAWWGDQRELMSVADSEDALAIVIGRPDGFDPRDPPGVELLAAYAAKGDRVAHGLKGRFSALIWDAAADRLLAIRDPIGVQPLFCTVRGEGIAVSGSPELLARSGTDRPTADRVALTEWVTTSTMPLARTMYVGIQRVPPGHVLTAGPAVVETHRYWSPPIASPDAARDDEGALARFDREFDDSIARCAEGGRVAVFLSGGLDSTLTAAAAAAHHAAHGLEPPLALTLKFSAPGEDEEDIAREVARRLHLPHIVMSLAEATNGQGLFQTGIEGIQRSWHPSGNPWNAAYARVACEATTHGCHAILTGEGGNDLLESPWERSGDLIRRGRLIDLARFIDAQPRYYGGASGDFVRQMVWSYGLAALARPVAHRTLLALAPGLVRRRRLRRAESALPVWGVPDSGLRAEVVQNSAAVTPPLTAGDLYGYARRSLLDNAFNAVLLENLYLSSTRASLETLLPYLDTSLVELVYALPPTALQIGGHAKGLSYVSLARRLGPGLASRLGPSSADRTFAAGHAAEMETLISRFGGLPRLSALGIVAEAEALRAVRSSPLGASFDPRGWRLISAEAWLQARDL